MARVSYPSNLSPEITDLLSRRGALNVMRMMAHAPGVMTAYSQLGVTLLRKGKLDPVLRELAILKIGLLCESEYEWHQHASIARTVG
ncbi:MAG: carboxymuconolactone decarboxylase family protein, partial [Steroidobacteraceae bacterium]